MERIAWQGLLFQNQYQAAPTNAEAAREVQNSTVAERREVLEMLIDHRLMLQAAERDRITITDSEINQQMAEYRNQISQMEGRPITDAEFALAIKNQTGQELPAFRDTMRQQAIVQKFLFTKKQDLFNTIREPTDVDILNVYSVRRTEFVRPEMIRFSMIQVPFGADAASKNRAKDLADRLSRDIASNPSRFDETAMRGQSPNAGYAAGDAGDIPRNVQAQQALGMEFINTAFSLRQGEVSRVIEGNGGYQIIKVTETYQQKSLELDDIIQPGSRVTVRQYIGSNLFQQNQQEILAKATQELVTELRSGNPFQVMENNLNW
jgi:peptidyl-prolyl cis-trans isomerase D